MGFLRPPFVDGHAVRLCELPVLSGVMDRTEISARTFSTFADRYRDKFMDLTMYDESYREFCDLLPAGRPRVLDAACGPGNVSRYLMSRRPDLDLLGIDLAPRMVEVAREAVPSARFLVHDCRHLAELHMRFDGIICAFGLPYLSGAEAVAFIRTAGQTLGTGGVLYLSTMPGSSESSVVQVYETEYEIYANYHAENLVVGALQECGFSRLWQRQLASPSTASKSTTDLIIIGKK